MTDALMPDAEGQLNRELLIAYLEELGTQEEVVPEPTKTEKDLVTERLIEVFSDRLANGGYRNFFSKVLMDNSDAVELPNETQPIKPTRQSTTRATLKG